MSKLKLPPNCLFGWNISKLKDWIDTLTVLQRHNKKLTFVVMKDQVFTTYKQDETIMHCSFMSNMVPNLTVRRPVIFGMYVPEWITILHYFKSQHARLVTVLQQPETGKIIFHAENPDPTRKTILNRDSTVIEVEPDIPVFKRNYRLYPLGEIQVPSKEFYHHCRNIALNNHWVEFEIDVLQQSMVLRSAKTSDVKIDVRLIPNRLNPLVQALEEEDISPALQLLVQSYITHVPLVVRNIFPADKLQKHSYAHKVNSFVSLRIADNTELLMTYVIKQSAVNALETSRIEGWIGYQVKRKNDALLQSKIEVECLSDCTSPTKVPTKKKSSSTHKRRKLTTA